MVLRFLALDANFKELRVSSISELSEAQVTINRVKELPPKLSYSNLVNLDYLYGIWSFFFRIALIVFPKQESDKLIFLAYSNPSPSTLDLLTF